ncbi:MAG: hypothetical protein P4L85_11090 [Paludisphaera borealis]|uniref:hypothetical protein n=1 Tax=Paludisphaera borealis TaxID=1387353 RepID=UPI00283FA5E6|nr:hypothetical protein [Paludisphaera borealis]MDR3619884.1 hypothetical protein [Paludisphaera borealis]
MKPIAGWLGAAILVLTFAGCDDGAPSTPVGNTTPTPDGRPAGFEDMMKGMGNNMAAKTKGGAKAAAPAAAPAPAAEPAK